MKTYSENHKIIVGNLGEDDSFGSEKDEKPSGDDVDFEESIVSGSHCAINNIPYFIEDNHSS